MKTIYEKLTSVQLALNVPKNQFNSFGKYHYRSLEDILETVKPLLSSHDLSLFISDAPVLIGDRHYIQSYATLVDNKTGDKIETSAVAMEPESKKGMDPSQITGAASSYCRKYLLAGLFLLDDNKDADSMKPAEPDADVLNLIAECESIAGLQAIWEDIPKGERAMYDSAKNAAKKRLGGSK
jgi:hypothetical protein